MLATLSSFFLIGGQRPSGQPFCWISMMGWLSGKRSCTWMNCMIISIDNQLCSSGPTQGLSGFFR